MGKKQHFEKYGQLHLLLGFGGKLWSLEKLMENSIFTQKKKDNLLLFVFCLFYKKRNFFEKKVQFY